MSAEQKTTYQNIFALRSQALTARTFCLIYVFNLHGAWPSYRSLTSGRWMWNSGGPRVTPLPPFLWSIPLPPHVSRFGRDNSLHILCSSVSATAAEKGEVIWTWWSYSVYKQIIASKSSDQWPLWTLSSCVCVSVYVISLNDCQSLTSVYLKGIYRCALFCFVAG